MCCLVKDKNHRKKIYDINHFRFNQFCDDKMSNVSVDDLSVFFYQIQTHTNLLYYRVYLKTSINFMSEVDIILKGIESWMYA